MLGLKILNMAALVLKLLNNYNHEPKTKSNVQDLWASLGCSGTIYFKSSLIFFLCIKKMYSLRKKDNHGKGLPLLFVCCLKEEG